MLKNSMLVAGSLWVLLSYSAQASQFPNTVKRVIDSVCLISYSTNKIVKTSQSDDNFNDDGLKGNPFEEYLKKNKLDGSNTQAPGPDSGSGTCFIISHKGKRYLVTNQHVANDEKHEYKVTFHNTLKHYNARLYASDKLSDLAVVEMKSIEGGRQLNLRPPIKWADSSNVRQGDEAFAIGHPLGMIWSVSKGIVSYNGRRLQNTWQKVIQTDVAINQGNSGGPLFNMMGEVIGVNTFIYTQGRGSVGINFSVDGNLTQYNINQLIEYKEVRRSKLGLAYTIDRMAGVLKIETVREGGPADQGGLKKGDVLVSINGVKANSMTSVGDALTSVPPGTKIHVQVLRNDVLVMNQVTTGGVVDKKD